MKLRILTGLVATSLGSIGCYAAEYGLSGEVGSESGVSIPIRFQNGFLLEPRVSYFSSEESDASDGFQLDSEQAELSFGVYAYRLLPMAERVNFQVGAGVGVVESSYEASIDNNQQQKNDLDGYFIAPSIGLFYSFTEKLDVGIESRFNYRTLEGEYVVDGGASVVDVERKSHSVKTQVVLRIFF